MKYLKVLPAYTCSNIFLTIHSSSRKIDERSVTCLNPSNWFGSRSKYFLSMNFLYYVDCESKILFPNFPIALGIHGWVSQRKIHAPPLRYVTLINSELTFTCLKQSYIISTTGEDIFFEFRGPGKPNLNVSYLIVDNMDFLFCVLSLLDINYYTFHMTASNNSLFLFVCYIVNRVDFPSGLYTTQMFETKYISGLRIFKGLTPCIPLDCQSTEEHVCLLDFPLDWNQNCWNLLNYVRVVEF